MFLCNKWIAGVTMVALNGGLLFLALTPKSANSAAEAPKLVQVPGNCGMCHRDIAIEWLNSLHAKAFTDKDFLAEAKAHENAESECFTCHSPTVVREKGLGKTPGFRTDVQDLGVHCQTCHSDLKGEVHAAFKSEGTPHPVVVDPQHRMVDLCASCHSAFGTVAEFKATAAAKKGVTCADCHMPSIARKTMKGEEKKGASHTWRGADDPNLMKDAIVFETAVTPAGELIAKITNKAAHNFPTGMDYHQALLVVTVQDAQGSETSQKQILFADQTKSGGGDTRIKADETREVKVDLGVTSGEVTSKLIYKRMPNVTLDEAVVVATATNSL